MTREEIESELRERAKLPTPLPVGLTEAEEIEWLTNLILDRRREMRLPTDKCPTTLTPRPAC